MAVILNPFGVGQKNTSIGFDARRFGFAVFFPLLLDLLYDFVARAMPGSMRERSGGRRPRTIKPEGTRLQPRYLPG
jgi:hypothetical protein